MKKLLAILAVLSVVAFAAADTKDDSGISNGFQVNTGAEESATDTTGDAEYAGNRCVDGSDDSCDNAQGNQKTLADLIGDADVTDLFPTEFA